MQGVRRISLLEPLTESVTLTARLKYQRGKHKHEITANPRLAAPSRLNPHNIRHLVSITASVS